MKIADTSAQDVQLAPRDPRRKLLIIAAAACVTLVVALQSAPSVQASCRVIRAESLTTVSFNACQVIRRASQLRPACVASNVIPKPTGASASR